MISIILYCSITVLISVGIIITDNNHTKKIRAYMILAWLVTIIISPIYIPTLIGATLFKFNK